MPSLDQNRIWTESKEKKCLQQVAELCERAFPLQIEFSSEQDAFTGRRYQKRNQGVLSVAAHLSSKGLVELEVEIFRGPEGVHIQSGFVFRTLADMHSRVSVVEHEKNDSTEVSYILQTQIQATPLSLARSNGLLAELDKINKLADILRVDGGEEREDFDYALVFAKFHDALRPVYPLQADLLEGSSELSKWVEETREFLEGSCPVAMVSPYPVAMEFICGALAGTARREEEALADYFPPAIECSSLLKLVQKAPGIPVFPATCLKTGNHPYDMHDEVRNTMVSLASIGKPVLFTGSLEDLQNVFSGGQGGAADPLLPVIRKIPTPDLHKLVRFKVRVEARANDQLKGVSLTPVIDNVTKDLAACGTHDLLRLLPTVVRRWLNIHGRSSFQQPDRSFAANLSSLTQTLGGLALQPRVERTPQVQERFNTVLASPELLAGLQDKLFGQDRALEQLASRLAMEILTRPTHQPLRYCAQGTPGTGKSESAVLLAQQLNIPYVNIDAASMPDFHTASSQLLGSGRGIVMSNKPGRLEQVAKHHAGALVEVSDLDHATPAVRSGLADLFLQVLETGEAQSATGSMFSCANLIFAFTMNLPGGGDETVRKSFGFNSSPSREEVTQRVITEIKMMLSSAFLSRTGTPILFDPLSSETMGRILDKTMHSAVRSALERLGKPVAAISLEPDLGKTILSRQRTTGVSFGARGILEQGRTMAAKALLDLTRHHEYTENASIHLSIDQDGRLVIEISQPVEQDRQQS